MFGVFGESFTVSSKFDEPPPPEPDGPSGTSAISPGTYHDVQVAADGNWTITITPSH